MLKNVVVAGGGVLGTQIGLMCAYTGHNVTFWLRSESSIERTTPKIKRYSELMLTDLENAKKLIGNPVGKMLYPRGMIRTWDGITAEKIDELLAAGKKSLEENIHIEIDMAKAVADADIVIESMSEDPEAKIGVYKQMKDLLPEKTILVTISSTMLPSRFAEYTGRPEKYLSLHFANTIWKNNTAEVMGHPGTNADIYKQVVAFADEINMVPLQLHKEQPGYILNTMLVPFLKAAQELWANEVSDPATIDLTWKLATGAPVGPFAILDIVGLETSYNIHIMDPRSKDESTVEYKICKLLKEMIDRGETGVNAGKGYFDYTK